MFGLHMINEMEKLQREMDQIFRSGKLFEPVRNEHSSSSFNLRDSGDALELQVALPGVDSEKLDISVLGRRLSLSGEYRAEEVAENVQWHRRERPTGKFEQFIQLPAAIDAEKVEAQYLNGILRVNLPKAQSERPLKIAVKSA